MATAAPLPTTEVSSCATIWKPHFSITRRPVWLVTRQANNNLSCRSAANSQRATGAEVVLNVDDDEGGGGRGHGATPS